MDLFYADSFFASKTFHTLVPFAVVSTITSTEKVSYVLSDAGEVYSFSRTSIPGSLNFPFRVIKISCGRDHSAIVTENSELFTWGNGKSGALGLGSTNSFTNPQKVNFSQDTSIINVSCGAWHTIIIPKCQTQNVNILVTGRNSEGQLGTGNTCKELIPLKIQFPEEILDVYCGTNHSIILSQSRSIYVTGDNSFGQLGLGHKRSSMRFLRVSLDNVEAIACGRHSAAIVRGQIFAWGTAAFGELLLPTLLPGPLSAIQVFVGDGIGCAIDTDNQLWLWGGRNMEKRALKAGIKVSCISLNSGIHVFTSSDPSLQRPSSMPEDMFISYSGYNTPKSVLVSPSRGSLQTKFAFESITDKNSDKYLTERKKNTNILGLENPCYEYSNMRSKKSLDAKDKIIENTDKQDKVIKKNSESRNINEEIKTDIVNDIKNNHDKPEIDLSGDLKKFKEKFFDEKTIDADLQEELKNIIKNTQFLYEENKKLRENAMKAIQEKEKLLKSFKSEYEIKKFYEEFIEDMEIEKKVMHEQMTEEISKLKLENEKIQSLLENIRQENNELCEKLLLVQKKSSGFQLELDNYKNTVIELESKIQVYKDEAEILASCTPKSSNLYEKKPVERINEEKFDMKIHDEGNKDYVEKRDLNEGGTGNYGFEYLLNKEEKIREEDFPKLTLNDLEEEYPDEPLLISPKGNLTIRTQKRTYEDIRNKVKILKKNRSTIQPRMQELKRE
ncbi:hypothetical protein SteCoe_17307 [Stentor coeruleus]|uniref:Uncharacterized protein n=1 Tax=Stentor coeruleus TaxID=5963 RepID=A0A1R2BZ93_9CILI|nr:hypothetical protein SteCoe_17307 [Stentor coeruleus]